MKSAIGDVVPSTLVTFMAQVKQPSDNSAAGKLGVTFLVDVSSLTAEDASGGGKRLNLNIYADIFSADGKLASNGGKKIDQVFDANTYQQLVLKGLATHLDLDPKPGQLRLAVQDVRTGMVGTINATAQ